MKFIHKTIPQKPSPFQCRLFPQNVSFLSGTKCVGYNRFKFLLDSLKDLDDQFRQISEDIGRLYIFQGKPVEIFHRIHQKFGIHKLCYEQDCEPIWNQRDDAVKKLCHELDIITIEKISHTLWDPKNVIDTNGGIPPLTYQMFLVTPMKENIKIKWLFRIILI